MKIKKILGLLLVVTLLSATVFGTASVFAAGAQTNVKLKSYMPPVKTIFADDNFQDRTVGDFTDKGTGFPNIKPNVWNGSPMKYEAESDGNKYITGNAWKTIWVVPETGYDVNRITFSFDISAETSGTEVQLCLSGGTADKVLKVRVKDSTGGDTGIAEVMYYDKASSSFPLIKTSDGKTFAPRSASQGIWNRVCATFKRVLQTDGSYNVYIESLYVNGTRFNTDTICENVIYNGTNGWWTLNSSSQFNAIFTQTSKAGWKLDNILIYEPYDVYMTDLNVVNKTVKIVNDGSNAVTGNVFIALYDNDKNLLAAKEASTELSVPAGGSQTVSLDDDTFGHENAKTAKIFFWNKSSLAPLCAAETVPLS